MPTQFGASDTLKCPECKDLMRLSRRSPHPVRGYDFELQSFTCRSCDHQIQREADVAGGLAA